MPASKTTTTQYLSYAVGVLWLILQWWRHTRPLVNKNVAVITKGKKKAEGYKTFGSDMRYLLKVCFPNFRGEETILAGSFVGILFLRTMLSLIVAEADGFIVKQLINRDTKQIVRGIVLWLLIALPSSFTNALIQFLKNRLALALRNRVTTHIRELYFENDSYYRTTHLDKRIPNPEHAMTEDVKQWAARVAELCSSMGKPLVDLSVFSSVLFKNLGFWNQFIASILVWESGNLLRFVRPDFGSLVQQQGALEADLRFQHTRVMTNSEEIAFHCGGDREKNILRRTYDKIDTFTRGVLKKHIIYTTAEDFVTKYLWTTVGTVQVALPILAAKSAAGDSAKYFITTRRVMVRNGDATERLMVGMKDIQEMGGYTKGVMDLIRVIKDQQAIQCDSASHVEFGEDIVLDNVPIVTPTKDILIPSMQLKLSPGDRLLIHGPNGCGKSSLFRILCGLWPMSGGRIIKPESRKDIYFLPQRPYLVQGSFRDQLIYPLTHDEMLANGTTDDDLQEILRGVELHGVCEVHGGLDAVKEWTEVLSGGEKQRVGIGRVFFHKPKFAILDECSSAINVDAEQLVFTQLKQMGMGLITISHRTTLFQHHTKLLTFDGVGGYVFNPDLNSTNVRSMAQKRDALYIELRDVLRTLGEDWPKRFPDDRVE